MGEYLVGAYLRLALDCEIVTYNQRLSRKTGEFGEADVLAIDIQGPRLYVCEVVTHLGGLLYAGGNEGSLSRLKSKFERIVDYSVKGFPGHDRTFMLWAPYVPRGYLTDGLAKLQDDMSRHGHRLELRINEEYTAAVDELREKARGTTKDWGEPFFRALQILEHLRRPRGSGERRQAVNPTQPSSASQSTEQIKELKAIRSRLRLTQAQLAEKLGITRSVYSWYEYAPKPRTAPLAIMAEARRLGGNRRSGQRS